MVSVCDISILVLAGGGSKRFGSNKALAELGDKPLVSHVIERLRPQTSGRIAINAKNGAEFAHLGVPIVSDGVWQGQGPLAGIRAALLWAKKAGAKQVVTTAVDLPLIPPDFIERLLKAGAPSIAMSGERRHPINGLWDCSQIGALDQYLQSSGRSAHGWAEHCGAKTADFPIQKGACDPFYNINTPDDLERLAGKLA